MVPHRCPARIGMPMDEIDTPALMIDLDAFEHNLKRMAEAVQGKSVRFRPHAKTHKCPVIARRQMALGAVGVCCQKVGEAEAMVFGGISDVLVSNEIVGPPKLARLAALARDARISVCADHPDQISAYSEAAKRFGVTFFVLVELNVGADRCGVSPGEPVLRLAEQIRNSPGLEFDGLQAYHGSAQHLRTPEERRKAIAGALGRVVQSRELLETHGIPCPNVTGAGTGTFRLEAESEVYTELQAGSYIFMDADYARNQDDSGAPVSEFRHSLFVFSTVISRPTADRAILDAGLKAHSVDSGMPRVHGLSGVEFLRASDEHGKLRVDPELALAVGDKVMLIPGHCDPTVNLYDVYVCLRRGRVEAIWPITARGALL